MQIFNQYRAFKYLQMNHRKKSPFASITLVLTLAILISLEQQICFTHGFHSSIATVERTWFPRALETTARTKFLIHIRRTTLARTTKKTPIISLPSSYGRGADIWPESNNDAVKLSDSFPNGIVPNSAAAAVAIQRRDNELKNDSGSSTTTKSPQRPRNYIQRILRRAASKEGLDNENEIGSVGKIPIAIALVLLIRGMVRPMDVALVASLTAYFTILNMTAQSTRDGGAPILPAVPSQGHVPSILSNPMGMQFKRSSTYRRWLILGALIGLFGPLAWLLVFTAGTTGMGLEAARVVARPLFLMCCQVTTEAISKRNLIPLPLRILVPIVYNASRLAYLWHWAFATSNISLGRIGRGLGIINAAYWAINLFAFLIPIASVRYMRAHFFGVEAEEVTTRIGLEETVGIVPNNN